MKAGSFTQQVKDEICANEEEKIEYKKALLSGFIKINGYFDIFNKHINLSTESPKIAKKIYQLLNEIYKVTPSISYQKKMKLDKGVIYHLIINEKYEEILDSLELFKDGSFTLPHDLIKDNTNLRYFIAGVFLASGSVNSPSGGNYHLQIVTETDEDGKFIIKMLNRFRNERKIESKIIQRRKKYVVYIKRADQIANFLAAVNAYSSLMEFENVRIQKDFLNSDNRYQICFNANYRKTLKKATKQVEDIKFINSKVGTALFNEKEKAVAAVRLKNPDAPLSTLSTILSEEYDLTISKSGVSRILNAIEEKANSLRGEK